MPIRISVIPDITLAALKSIIDFRAFILLPIKNEPAVTRNTKETREGLKLIEFEIENPTAKASALTAIEINRNLKIDIDLFPDGDSLFSNIEFNPK